MAMRNIVEIDEEKCDGCGNCVIACAEGALEIRDGKAKIIKEIYCDGLGACIGECPQDALTVAMKESDPFDEAAMEAHLKTLREKQVKELPPEVEAGCPGAKLVSLPQRGPAVETQAADVPASELRNWPIQIHLIPPTAPFFNGADLLIAADCLPFAMAGFHQSVLQGKILAVGCPKLDDTEAYVTKFAQIFASNDIKSITIGYMEVPCCAGLLHVVHKALEASGKPIPVSTIRISVQGEICQEGEENSRVKSIS
jgi:Pyruvate/2-oxoacid:ferredoxin oxidoreductase delta subunit